MSGMYGTVKAADINISNDVEIFYNYRESINSDLNELNFETLNPNTVLSECRNGQIGVISGLFNLKLPLDKFNRKGFYTIYIRPKEYEVSILDVGTLAAFPDVRGIVFGVKDNMDIVTPNAATSNAFVGYRVEYINNDNNKKTGDFKIITSSNLVDVTTYALNNTSSKSTKYFYTNVSNTDKLFCTVTPSLSSTYMPNNFPYIGTSSERVKIVNTKFNPIMLELELVEHDDETIAYMLEGNQLIDKDSALITTFNDKGEIYHQSEYGAYKDEYGKPLYEFKKTRDNIDFNQNLNNLE